MRRTLLALWFLLLLAWPGHAAVWWLNPATGLDTNPGTVESSAWKTMFKVKTAPGVGAGDTINIVGGTYTQAQVAGQSGIPIWNQGHHLGSAGNPITIQAKPGATVVFDGGGATWWQRFYTSGAYSGHYLVIKNLTFKNYMAEVIGLEGASQATPTKYIAVVGCTFKDMVQQQSAPMAPFNANHIIIANNTIINIGGPAQSNVGDNLPQNQHGVYVADDAHFIVIDKNKIEKISGFAVHMWNSHPSGSNTSSNVIVRHNTLVNSHASGHIIAGDRWDKVYVYNNTYYNEAIPFAAIDSLAGKGAITFHNGANSYSNITIKNNIGYGSWAIDTFVQENSAQFSNLVSDYNVWVNLQDAARTIKWNTTEYTLAGFQAAQSREVHSLASNPLFTSSSTRDFTLAAGSPAIDAGQVLTTTVGSGSGTTVPVADAGYFHDGYGLLTGDTVVIGSTTVTLTSVNYSTNVLTVTPSLTWTSGQAVTFPYNGAAPDMGAFESGGGGTPPVAAGLQAQWKFDEGSGTAAADATGNAHTGTITGAAVWAPGRHGPKSLQGDGVATMTTVTSAFPYTRYTWMLWIKGNAPPGTSTVQQALVNGSDPDNFGLSWSSTDPAFVQAAYHQDNAGTYVAAQLTTPLQAGVWYCIAATYDGTTLLAYLNGQVQGSVAVSSLATAVGNFGIGNNPNRARWFAGQVDNVKLYNTALAAAEVLAEYRLQAGMYHKRITRR